MILDHDQVAQDPGDDTVILRTLVHWVDSNIAATTSPSMSRPCGHIARDAKGVWRLAMAVQRGPTKRQRHFIDVDPMGTREDRWPLHKLSPGVWDISKSVYIEGQMHAFITVVGIPDPAPWEAGYVQKSGTVISIKDPTPAELGDFAGMWTKKIIESSTFKGITGYAVVLSRADTLVFMAATEPGGGPAFRAALMKHLTERST
jgi:hypothetical protein